MHPVVHTSQDIRSARRAVGESRVGLTIRYRGRSVYRHTGEPRSIRSPSRVTAPEAQSLVSGVSRTIRVVYALCVIVHKLDRLARNRADDVAITQRFDAHSIRLVSTSENIDQTPGGMLLHGIMSSIAEFYSRNLAGEVVKGMTQKARSGGIITRAPLGYLNTRRITNGREERTATIDEERAPLIRWAFEAYATGNWSLKTLTAELNRRGLTTLATANTASNPVQVRTVHGILTNPFYTGVITYQGTSYPGQHTGLVDPAVFETVQTVLRGKLAGERVITHDHYLKSTLFCGQCGFRMIVQVTTNRHGTTYPYYACLGRHSKRTKCTLRSIQIDHVEDLITDLYERIALTD